MKAIEVDVLDEMVLSSLRDIKGRQGFHEDTHACSFVLVLASSCVSGGDKVRHATGVAGGSEADIGGRLWREHQMHIAEAYTRYVQEEIMVDDPTEGARPMQPIDATPSGAVVDGVLARMREGGA